jgi:hypothetical protein
MGSGFRGRWGRSASDTVAVFDAHRGGEGAMSERGKGFEADPRAIHTFGVDFQHDLDVHLSAEMVQSLHLFSDAQMFGIGTASPTVHEAAEAYHHKLMQLFDLMDGLVYEGAVMAQAAHAIAEAYADADKISSGDIGAAVSAAQLRVDADAVAAEPKTGRPI